MDSMKMKRAAKELVHLFFPSVCMVCGRVLVSGQNCTSGLLEMNLCLACLSAMPLRLSRERWFPCLSDPYSGDPIPDFMVWVLFRYEMPVSELLRRMKFHSAKYCGQTLGILMGRELSRAVTFRPDAVLPIPLSEQRRKKRGYNQAAVLGAGVSRYFDTPLLENVLVRVRHTKQQSRFHDPVARAQNLENAFDVSEEWDIRGWNIVLVDDILTTGATLHEAAKVLLEKGAASVIGAVCASHR
jgi:ComF family protein